MGSIIIIIISFPSSIRYSKASRLIRIRGTVGRFPEDPFQEGLLRPQELETESSA